MRAVLQRVKSASVSVNGQLVSTIGPGVLALVAVGTEDTLEQVPTLASRILNLKLWNEGQKATAIATASKIAPTADPAAATGTDDASSRKEEVWGGKPWKTSVVELEGEVLCVSQFTLYARTIKGTKPDFHKSMGGVQAREIYNAFLEQLGQSYRPDRIKDGAFGEMMDVSLVNDGPVTLILDSADKR